VAGLWIVLGVVSGVALLLALVRVALRLRRLMLGLEPDVFHDAIQVRACVWARDLW
jgi:hypothetical protein